MTTDFIVGICLVGVSVVAALMWPVGRAIILDTVRHPLRRSVLHKDREGNVTVMSEEDSKAKWQEVTEAEERERQFDLVHTSGA